MLAAPRMVRGGMVEPICGWLAPRMGTMNGVQNHPPFRYRYKLCGGWVGRGWCTLGVAMEKTAEILENI